MDQFFRMRRLKVKMRMTVMEMIMKKKMMMTTMMMMTTTTMMMMMTTTMMIEFLPDHNRTTKHCLC